MYHYEEAARNYVIYWNLAPLKIKKGKNEPMEAEKCLRWLFISYILAYGGIIEGCKNFNQLVTNMHLKIKM